MTELKTMLLEGLDQYNLIYPENFIENMKQEFQENEFEEKLKFLLEKLLSPFIDSKLLIYYKFIN